MPALPLVAGLISAAALLGWLVGIVPLRQVMPDRAPMQAHTAIALLIASAAALLLLRDRPRGAAILGFVLSAFGAVTLVDYFTADQSSVIPRVGNSAAMAVQTAACVVALGLAFALSPGHSKVATRLREFAALFVALVAYVALVGHILGARTLWIFATTQMALNTAIALAALSLTVLLTMRGPIVLELARAEEGGNVARKLLPIALVVPVIIGWLRLVGEQGGLFETRDGAAILVVTSALLFATATWWVARIANRVASERARARSQLRETEIEREVRMRFVRSLAHDLRAPLASIRAGAERLAGTCVSADDRRISQIVTRGVDRLDRMIRDLLDVERARSGDRIATDRVDGDAAAIIDEILGSAAVVHGKRLEADVERPIPGRFDRHALERILENLIGNAFKYGAQNGRVRVTARAAGEQLVMAVHNEGNPLRPSEIPQLLEPFRRGSDTHGRTGWGIGLPVVRGLCDALGGRLEVESSADAGTTFRVLLPLN